MSAGQVAPSRILRKLAAYPRQNDLEGSKNRFLTPVS